MLFPPAKDAKGAERVPAAGLADGFAGGHGEGFVVGTVQEPATVGLAAAFDEMNSFAETRIGRDMVVHCGGTEVVEGAKNVVVVARREGELEKFRMDDLASGEAAEEGALKQVFFGAMAGGRDFFCVGGSGADGAFILEKALENADGGVERGAATLGGFAIPTAFRELFGEETAREDFVGAAEVGAEREDAAVDARLDFADEEGIATEFGGAEIPVGLIAPAEICFGAGDGGADSGIGGVGASRAEKNECEESGEPNAGAGASPGAVGVLSGENSRGESFM